MSQRSVCLLKTTVNRCFAQGHTGHLRATDRQNKPAGMQPFDGHLPGNAVKYHSNFVGAAQGVEHLWHSWMFDLFLGQTLNPKMPGAFGSLCPQFQG